MSNFRPIQLVDPMGNIIPHTSNDDKMIANKFGTANIKILSYAIPDAAQNEPKWKIIYFDYDAAGNPVATTFANSKKDYIHTRDTAAGTAITGASVAAICVVTSVGHDLVTGDFIEIDSMAVGGMVELNDDGYGSATFHVTKLNANTFSLQEANVTTTDIDSTGYAAYTTGGKYYKREFLNYPHV